MPNHLLVRKPVRCANKLDAIVEKTSKLQQRQFARALRTQPENIRALIVGRFSDLERVNQ
jgi:hypothetical protein